MESILIIILYVVVIVGFMYFVMIRPENKRKKEVEAMRKAVTTGDRIVTIGGIIGTVVSDNDDKIVIETSGDRVRVELMRWAISSLARDDDGTGENNA